MKIFEEFWISVWDYTDSLSPPTHPQTIFSSPWMNSNLKRPACDLSIDASKMRGGGRRKRMYKKKKNQDICVLHSRSVSTLFCRILCFYLSSSDKSPFMNCYETPQKWRNADLGGGCSSKRALINLHSGHYNIKINILNLNEMLGCDIKGQRS